MLITPGLAPLMPQPVRQSQLTGIPFSSLSNALLSPWHHVCCTVHCCTRLTPSNVNRQEPTNLSNLSMPADNAAEAVPCRMSSHLQGMLLTHSNRVASLIPGHTSAPTYSLIHLRPHLQGVPLTHGNMVASLMNIMATYELTPKDRSYLVMPLFHVHGLMVGPALSGMGGRGVMSAHWFRNGHWVMGGHWWWLVIGL